MRRLHEDKEEEGREKSGELAAGRGEECLALVEEKGTEGGVRSGCCCQPGRIPSAESWRHFNLQIKKSCRSFPEERFLLTDV